MVLVRVHVQRQGPTLAADCIKARDCAAVPEGVEGPKLHTTNRLDLHGHQQGKNCEASRHNCRCSIWVQEVLTCKCKERPHPLTKPAIVHQFGHQYIELTLQRGVMNSCLEAQWQQMKVTVGATKRHAVVGSNLGCKASNVRVYLAPGDPVCTCTLCHHCHQASATANLKDGSMALLCFDTSDGLLNGPPVCLVPDGISEHRAMPQGRKAWARGYTSWTLAFLQHEPQARQRPCGRHLDVLARLEASGL
mmetsp:Transcript_24520/g.70446  ORF Transcript_24520/g.70446 Transcript_24520/m.70446 type:complete len:249 (-) Transcript_24520:974-1720(-)